MSDDRLRGLERAAAAGDQAAMVRLKAEQLRAGLRKEFPPRRKVPASERAGVGFPTWCPACRTWSLYVTPQKLRSRRKGKERRPRRWCRMRSQDRIYETSPFRAVPVGSNFTIHAGMGTTYWHKVSRRHAVSYQAFESADVARERWTPFDDERVVGYRSACAGPKKGEHVRIPLEVLEARLHEVADPNDRSDWRPEFDWLYRRIEAARRKLGILPPSEPCRHPRLDYVRRPYYTPSGVEMEAVDRTRVRCQDCGAILHAATGRVTIVGGTAQGSGNGGGLEIEGGSGTRMQ